MPGKLAIALTFTLILTLITGAFGGTEKVLYSFTGGDDGDQPYAGVIFDGAGNLYGTTQLGGAHGVGVVFKLTPSQNGWTETVLYTFTGGTDGRVPLGGVVFDEAGNIYGTTSEGGDPVCQCGVVYKLTPSGTFSIVHTFVGGNDGEFPATSLDYCCGYLHGTTVGGGSRGKGTAFEVSVAGGKNYVTPFNGTNGYQPWASLNRGIGTTFLGGRYSDGNVFRLDYHTKNLHVFNPAKLLGTHLLGPVIEDSHANLYGTAYDGGSGGYGTVYELMWIPTLGHYKPIVVHGFTFTDGAGPASGLVMDAAGNLYGATTIGGNAGISPDGVVFKMTPGLKNKWTETVLYNFSGDADGGGLYGTIISDAAGNLYGTGIDGGAHGHGVVYEVVP